MRLVRYPMRRREGPSLFQVAVKVGLDELLFPAVPQGELGPLGGADHMDTAVERGIPCGRLIKLDRLHHAGIVAH